MDEQMIEPCPFCGSADVAISDNGRGLVFTVHCGKCRAAGPWEQAAIDAKDTWNHRAAHSVMAGKVAELEEALKQAALDLHEAAGRFAIHTELDLLACSELTRKAARRADAALAPYPERRSE